MRLPSTSLILQCPACGRQRLGRDYAPQRRVSASRSGGHAIPPPLCPVEDQLQRRGWRSVMAGFAMRPTAALASEQGEMMCNR